jgi:prephenate dehydrogenase
MPTYRKVAIVGVGLIGGSIGLALRQRGLAQRVVGIGRRQSSLDKALACQAIDETATDLEKGVDGAELVVVATPVAQVADLVCRALAATPEDLAATQQRVVVTDAGSTKGAICAAVESRLQDAAGRFVGSHPLAGDHRSGPEHAHGDLFDGKTVVMTPTESTPTETMAKAEAFWQNLGARVTKLSPTEHDEALAATSHLPHLLASALATATPAEWLPLAATGWADTTRVAAGDPELWTQVLAQNKPAVLAALDRLSEQLEKLQADLLDENWSELRETLQNGKRIRDALGS